MEGSRMKGYERSGRVRRERRCPTGLGGPWRRQGYGVGRLRPARAAGSGRRAEACG